MKKAFDLRKGVDFIGVTCVFYCHDGQGNLLLPKPLHSMLRIHLKMIRQAGAQIESR